MGMGCACVNVKKKQSCLLNFWRQFELSQGFLFSRGKIGRLLHSFPKQYDGAREYFISKILESFFSGFAGAESLSISSSCEIYAFLYISCFS